MTTIKIPTNKKIDAIKAAYDLSRPVGMGFMHYQPGGLTDEEAQSLVQPNGRVRMDYVKGRCCKFKINDKGTHLEIFDPWHDHSAEDLEELLRRIGEV